MAMLRERKISVYYKEPEVSADELKMIFNFWIKDVPIIQMMRRMQPSRVARHQQPLIYVDIYSILFTLLAAEQITQRRTNPYEMTIKDFAAFFQIWKQSGTYAECYSALSERPEVKTYATNVFRSISDRYRREQAANCPADISSGKSTSLAIKQHILSLATRRKIDNRQALVIFIDQIPIGLISQLKGMKDIGIHFDTTLQSGDEIVKKIAEYHSPTIKKDTPPDDDLKALDPTGEYEEEGHVRKSEQAEDAESARKLRPKPASRAEQLAALNPRPPVPATRVSTADGIVFQQERDNFPPRQQQPKPLVDTTSVAELLEPSELDLSLDNLMDDDQLEP